MTTDLLTKYARMIEEIQDPSYRGRMAEYLLKTTREDIDHKIADYISRLENNYSFKREDEFLMAIEEFERRGTLRPAISIEESLEIARQSKRETGETYI